MQNLSWTSFWLAAAFYSVLTSAHAFGDTISLLTYNVRGLPPLIEDRKDQVTAIAKQLGHYDVVLLQEVFAYDRHVVEVASPLQYFAGPGPQRRQHHRSLAVLMGYVPCRLSAYCELPMSAGLSILVFDDSINAEVIARKPYGACHGYFTAKNDCLANKGLLGVSLRKDGSEIHVFNTHLDSGRSDADRRVRAQQLLEAARTINRLSADKTVIFAGDFNLKQSDPEDMRLRAEFLQLTGLKDTGAREPDSCEFGCKALDSIFYRGTDILIGDITQAHAERFVDNRGRGLSDHPPLGVNFTQTAAADTVAPPSPEQGLSLAASYLHTGN